MNEDIIFKSAGHKQRFLAAIQNIGKVYGDKIDPEYGAALYILTSQVSTWNKASDYVSRDGIDFEAMLKEVDFSGAYSVIIDLAGNLFNGNTHIDPVELLRLDEQNFQIALDAIKLRRSGMSVSKPELYNAMIDERNRIAYENREKPWLPLYDGE